MVRHRLHISGSQTLRYSVKLLFIRSQQLALRKMRIAGLVCPALGRTLEKLHKQREIRGVYFRSGEERINLLSTRSSW